MTLHAAGPSTCGSFFSRHKITRSKAKEVNAQSDTPFGPRGHIMEVRMTSSKRNLLRQLRRSGKSYGQIAKTLNISENTAKSICRREGILAVPQSADHCPRCGGPISHAAQGPRRRFCSDTCRYAWNFAHRVLSEINAVSKRCDCCGQLFFSYPSSGRKYCSRACYIRDRFGKEARHGSRTV